MSFGFRATGGLMMNVKILFGLVVFGELLQPVAVGFRAIGMSWQKASTSGFPDSGRRQSDAEWITVARHQRLWKQGRPLPLRERIISGVLGFGFIVGRPIAGVPAIGCVIDLITFTPRLAGCGHLGGMSLSMVTGITVCQLVESCLLPLSYGLR